MAKAKKLPSGNWRVLTSVSVGGKRYRQSFTSPDKRTAELEAAKWVNDIGAAVRRSDNLTLGQAALSYINSKRNVLSPVTIKTYEGYCRRYLTDLQSRNIKKITSTDLQLEFNDMAAVLSPKTLKSVYGFFRSVFSQFSDTSLNVRLPLEHKKIYETPDAERSRDILKAAAGTNIELPVNLALRCGLRVSEICGLKWSSVQNDTLIIDNVIVSFGTEQIEKKPKSAAGNRKVPLPEDIKQMINAQPRINEYVYQKNSKAIGAAFRRLLAKNNLPPMPFHNLRHGFASSMAVLGIPERYAMSIGGWDTSTILHSIYEQTFSAKEREYANMINEYFTKE